MLSVLSCQEVGPSAGGVGVRGSTSSFDSTASGLSGTKPVALKLDLILSDEKARLYTCWKAARKAFLSMWLIEQSAKALISSLYARFKGKTAHVKRLQNMGGVWRHTECNNLAKLAQILEGKRLVALMAIKNKQPVATYCPGLCMVDKVPQPGKTKLICCPAVVTDSYPPVFRVVIPGSVVVLCFEDKEGWDHPPYSVDAGDQRCPLTVARLDPNWLETSLRGCYHLYRPSNTYLEASLVKVVRVFVQNAILGINIAYKVKPGTNNSWIAA